MKSLRRIIVLLVLLAMVTMSSVARIYYVKADSDVPTNGTDTGRSWDTPMSLADALNYSVAGDEIWVRGYRESEYSVNKYYKVPSRAGFSLKPGVRLYGGFYGDDEQAIATYGGVEEKISDRPYTDSYDRLTFRSVIVGDVNGDDYTNTTYLFYPNTGNKSCHDDNAYHVITVNLGTTNEQTIVDGFTIASGQAYDESSSLTDAQCEASSKSHGGGILVTQSGTVSGQYIIRRCFFINNYGLRGGAIYVDSSVKNNSSAPSLIIHNTVFNNMAGLRSEDKNRGGGIYMAGEGTIVNNSIYNNEKGGVYLDNNGSKLVNCTVVRNSNAAVDVNTTMAAKNQQRTFHVANTVMWGNTRLANDTLNNRPLMKNCAYYWVQDGSTTGSIDERVNGNISIKDKNEFVDASKAQALGPCFLSPSNTTGFDRTYDWEKDAYPTWDWDIDYDSRLVDNGDNDSYDAIYTGQTTYADKNRDMVGDLRQSYNGTIKKIDIGAFEYQHIDADRIIRVSPSGNDSNDGLSWDKAMRSPQAAIDRLEESGIPSNGKAQRGQIWLAAGVYEPQTYWKEGTASLFFRMKDGINVFGGFIGNSTVDAYGNEIKKLSDDEIIAAVEKAAPSDKAALKGKLQSINNIIEKGGETSVTQRVQLRSFKNGGETLYTTDDIMPWNYRYESILRGANWSESAYSDNCWQSNGESTHVVWLGPSPTNNVAYTQDVILDGITIEGGNATGSGDMWASNSGGGVCMFDEKARVQSCIVRNNTALSKGGGIYCKNGRVDGTLVHNNGVSGDDDFAGGGGVYIASSGILHRSMVFNNTAADGGGVFLWGSGDDDSNGGDKTPMSAKRIVATSLVTNNTSRENGAIYMYNGGVVEQSTIANNKVVRAVDVVDELATNTAGIYIYNPVQKLSQHGTSLIVNNIIANNFIQSASSVAQIYANPDGVINLTDDSGLSNVQFYNNGVSTVNSSVWNHMYVSETSALETSLLAQYFELGQFENNSEQLFKEYIGVQTGIESTSDISYYWLPRKGSYLARKGLNISMLPAKITLQPELSLIGKIFEGKPVLGARKGESVGIVPELVNDTTLRIYVSISPVAFSDGNGGYVESNGSSWYQNYDSPNDAISFMASIGNSDTLTVVKDGTKTPITVHAKGKAEPAVVEGTTLKHINELEVCMREGDLYPRYNFVNKDEHSASYVIGKQSAGLHLTIKGGYKAQSSSDTETTVVERNPDKYRSDLNGRNGGIYHVVTVNTGANVTFDGFAFTDGYAGGTGLYHYGAGLLIYAGGIVEVRNSVFENNIADTEGAAIYAYQSTSSETPTKLTLRNCVINNNTNYYTQNNTDNGQTGDAYSASRSSASTNSNGESASQENRIIGIEDDELNTLQIDHVTFVNNVGLIPYYNSSDDATKQAFYKTSFAAGNVKNLLCSTDNTDNNTLTISTLDSDGAKFFSNPTKTVGAKRLGNVYYGGDAKFQPLTTVEAATGTETIINKCDEIDTSTSMQYDITCVNERDLGGKPDLGAYEADLPKKGTVIYVRDLGENTDKGGNGQSWDQAINGNCIAYINDHNFKGYDAELYAEGDSLTGLQWAVDEAYYRSLKKNSTGIEYRTINSWTGQNPANNKVETWNLYIYDESKSKYVASSKDVSDVVDESRVEVFVAKGEYIRGKGFFMREGVDVYGGFPSTGNPNDDDRSPHNYETIIETNKDGEENWGPSLHDKDGSSNKYELNRYGNAYKSCRVLTQQFPYYMGNKPDGSQGVSGNMEYYYIPVIGYDYETVWNGFTIRNGRTRIAHQRDGGAGVALRHNGVIENCVIENNINKANNYGHIRGGGVFCADGTIKNSIIRNNELEAGWGDIYGGGLYLRMGVVYNTSIIKNKLKVNGSANKGNSSSYNGSGAFFENGLFLNNTVCGNVGYNALASGNWFGNGRLVMYNTIIYDNDNGSYPDIYNRTNTVVIKNCLFENTSKVPTSNMGSFTNTFVYGDPKFADLANGDYRLTTGSPAINTADEDIKDESDNTYELPSADADYNIRIQDCALDIGAYEYDNAANISYSELTNDTLAYYVCENGWGQRSAAGPANAACASKLQTVLKKAGETKAANKSKTVVVKVAGYNENTVNIKRTINYVVTTSTRQSWVGKWNEKNKYYTNYTKSGDSYTVTYTTKDVVDEEIVQDLADITRTSSTTITQTNPASDADMSSYTDTIETVTQVIETTESYTEYVTTQETIPTFVFHANELADENDSRSYTYLIPDGVVIMGGYSEGTGSNGVYVENSGWESVGRNVLTCKTMLSAETQAEAGTDVPGGVYGYHVVTFGSWPSQSSLDNYSYAAKNGTVTGMEMGAIVDGVWLTNGDARDEMGWKGIGGAAVVPSGAHVKNCVVTSNTAIQGGGLYLLPGALVTGTLIYGNTAETLGNEGGQGGGVYGDNGDVSSSDNEGKQHTYQHKTENAKTVTEDVGGIVTARSHMVSCTIAENKAETGGGVYHEDGSLLMINDIVWNNTASTDLQIGKANSGSFASKVIDLTYCTDATGTITDNTSEVLNQLGTIEVYPYNDCFVSDYDNLVANTRNTSITNDQTTYFLANTYIPRTYSPLVNQGMEYRFQTDVWETVGASQYDMESNERIPVKDRTNNVRYRRVTPGAFAINTPQPEGQFFKLFVSQNGGLTIDKVGTDAALSDGVEATNAIKSSFVGRSFYTAFNSLQRALDYIEEVRALDGKAEDGESYKTHHFDIFMSEGTYKPTVRRSGSSDSHGSVTDERDNSFCIPANVSIFGGFKGDENYAVLKDGQTSYYSYLQVEDENGQTEVKALNFNFSIKTALDARNDASMLNDLVSNGLLEPWGFKYQTILDGNVHGSSSEDYVYHVVFSKDETVTSRIDKDVAGVLLDGLSIINGHTSANVGGTRLDASGTALANDNYFDTNEIGHGGGIFSDGVNYTLNRCRIINNNGVHGGGVFLSNANLNVIGSVFEANKAVAYVDSTREVYDVTINNTTYDKIKIVTRACDSQGGAVALNNGAFNAVNSLFVNNEAETVSGNEARGGAVYLGGTSTADIMNCIIARNMAAKDAAIYMADGTGDKYVTNTVIWGNRQSASEDNTPLTTETKTASTSTNGTFSHCASDNLNIYVPIQSASDDNGNILLSIDNTATIGPRFKYPSTDAGVDGERSDAQWNPMGVTVLTDAGTGMIDYVEDEDSEYLGKENKKYADIYGNENSTGETGAYMNWWKNKMPKDILIYMDASEEDETKRHLSKDDYVMIEPMNVTSGASTYKRYQGPRDGDYNEMKKTIDIGIYEYQYDEYKFNEYNVIYVDTIPRGTGDGTSWTNAMGDLRGAIIAMAHPVNVEKDFDAVYDRVIFVRDGNYPSSAVVGGRAYSLNVPTMENSDENKILLSSITIKGSCTGRTQSKTVVTMDENGNKKVTFPVEEQDFSKQTVLVPNDLKEGSTEVLLEVTLGKAMNFTTSDVVSLPVTIEGFTFKNNSSVAKTGVQVDRIASTDGVSNRLTFKNCMFRENNGQGLYMNSGKDVTNEGNVLIYNTLFADNSKEGELTSQDGTMLDKGVGINPAGKVTVVNATFANNTVDMAKTPDEDFCVYNTVSWNNGTVNLMSSEGTKDANGNINLANRDNDNLLEGPNFADPSNETVSQRDYSIHPSLLLLDEGYNTLYINNVVKVVGSDSNQIPSDETDLASEARLTSGNIDIGAYEYAAELQPIVYVNSNNTSRDGTSWNNAFNNLQNAIDMASLYAVKKTKDMGSDAYGYVFVDREFSAKSNVTLSQPRVKVYGGMNKENVLYVGGTVRDGNGNIVYDKDKASSLNRDLVLTVNDIETNLDKILGGKYDDNDTDNDKFVLKRAQVDDGNGNYQDVSDDGLVSRPSPNDRGLLDLRKGTVENTSLSTLKGLKIEADNCVVDGFIVTGDVYIGKGVLATSVINATTVGGSANGMLYNSLVLAPASVTEVKAVNVTSVGTLPDNNGGNNRASVVEKNNYVTTDYWTYQLNENDKTNLDVTDDGNSRSALTEECETLVGHACDLAGNRRIRSTVDNGCFETWNIKPKMTIGNVITAVDYPHGKSVVYVRNSDDPDTFSEAEGAELSIDDGVYTASTGSFNPGFLLLEHRTGLRGNNNMISLSNYAVERNVKAGVRSMTSMPFDAGLNSALMTTMKESTKYYTFTNAGKTLVTSTPKNFSVKAYNGRTRSSYQYKFVKAGSDGDECKAWETGTIMEGEGNASDGRLLDNVSGRNNIAVRFYGKSYTEETDKAKEVVLTQYNNTISKWTDGETSAHYFTHKENMGWNIFGSPYLCSMNYKDMEYGRVMYYYANDKSTTSEVDNSDDTFVPMSTVLSGNDSNRSNLSGYIPMGDALFTQTATLKGEENFTVDVPTIADGKNGTAYETPNSTLVVGLTRAFSRAGDSSATDELQLNAVSKNESHTDFDINSDGVKWMGDSVPQLYAEQDGGRYSLLSAVNIDGVVKVGVTLPEAGSYVFSVPEDCDTEKYESVILKDTQTHSAVDLLENSYDFSTVENGDISGRFTIVFNQKVSDKVSDIKAFSPERSHIMVTGVKAGDLITAYSADGSMAAKMESASTTCEFIANIVDVAIVEVQRDGAVLAVKKIRMR